MLETLIIAIGLGLDAFSLATAFGMCQKTCPQDAKLRLSFSFGAFQFLMPLVGFGIGSQVAQLISSFDHWVVLGVLSLVGGKMIYEGWKRDDHTPFVDFSHGWPLLFASLATSIDALAVGFSFALINENIWLSALIIGIVALFMTYLGASLGHKIRGIFSSPEVWGGIAIVLVGLKIFLEDL